MKKYLLRIIVFAVTFAVGVGLIWSFGLFNFSDDSQAKIVSCPLPNEAETLVETSQNGKVEIRFKEFIREKEGLAMKLEIVNKNTEAARYSAYSYGKTQKTGTLMAYLKADGKELEGWYCGTGLEKFELKPGQSIEYRVSGLSVSHFFDKGKTFQVGFIFDLNGSRVNQKYWSENLPITPEIRSQMIKDLKEIEKSRQ